MPNGSPAALKIAAVVMTANEAENISKCLTSLQSIDKVFVLDSASSDGTIEIARSFPNVEVIQTPWLGYAKTFNSGIDMAKDFDWIIRIDADEEMVGDIRTVVGQQPQAVAGLVVWRPIYFLGEQLRYGPHSRLKMLRIFRGGRGRCEETSADEHILVDGEALFVSEIKMIDRDLKPFSLWLTKHIRWAKKEAANTLKHRNEESNIDRFNRAKRFAKMKVYYNFPPFVRVFFYFLFRFFFQLECLGGRAGISWCIMQGLWYRLMVDFFLWHPELIERD